MTRTAVLRTLRGLAIAIALAGAWDPALTSNRVSNATVAVVTADLRDSALGQRVVGDLSKRFTVTRGIFSAADATVLVGNRLPNERSFSTKPAFAIFDQRNVAIENVRVPAAAPAGSRVPVDAVVHARSARGRTLDVSLRAGGLVVDRFSRPISSDDERVNASLAFVPPEAGAAPLDVVATIRGASDSATTDVVVDVREQKWTLLFFDPRPSWMTTFVRRAAERDARFAVTSRTVTSRGVSADAGQPPARLDDLAALKMFDAVVVGAPEALTDRDVAGLEAFMRRRGGAVLLLLDRRTSGPYERLLGVQSWIADSNSRAMSIVPSGDTTGLRATEIAAPRRLPAAAITLAPTSKARVDSLNGRAAVWQLPVGSGRLIVSGALDSWRYRDASLSAFDRFWRTIISDAASASPPPIGVVVSSPAARAGERVRVDVSLRDVALSTARNMRASVTAVLASDSTTDTLRLLPTGMPGQLRAEFDAPSAKGSYRVVVTSEAARADAPMVVSATATHPTPDDRDLVSAWAASRGGRAMNASQLGELPSALRAAIQPIARAETWHPMRSAWWIVPFALLLSAEWWGRRRWRGSAVTR